MDIQLGTPDNASVGHSFLYKNSSSTVVHGKPMPTVLPVSASDVLSLDRQLAAISFLQEDWDGYGASPISKTVQSNVRFAAEQMMAQGAPAPQLIPVDNGTVSLEWEMPTGEVILEVGRTKFSFVMHRTDGHKVLVDGLLGQLNRETLSFMQSWLRLPPAINRTTPLVFRLGSNVL